jgi:hypothetical protein
MPTIQPTTAEREAAWRRDRGCCQRCLARAGLVQAVDVEQVRHDDGRIEWRSICAACRDRDRSNE